MNELTCREIDELLAAYALDALDAGETAAAEHHLVECRLHDAELADYRSVTGVLPAVLSPRAPSADVRGNLLDAFDKEVAGGQPAASEPVRLTPRRLWQLPAFAYGLAAAFMVLALGLAAWGFAGRDGSEVVVRTAQTDGQRIELVYLPDRHLAVLQLDLALLPPDRAYQAWQITETGPESLGVIGSQGVMALNIDLSRASAIAISVEPSGGSPAPTTTPILVSEL